MKKPKILFLKESIGVGGAEKALVSLLRLINYDRFDVTLMLITKQGSFLKDAAAIKGLKIRHYVEPAEGKLRSFLNAVRIKSIYKLVPARFVGDYLCTGYDTVVAFTEGYLTKWVGASTVGCKKIAWVHTDMVNNDWPVETGVFKSLADEQKAYSVFDSLVGVSEIVTLGMKKKFGVSNIQTIFNIIDPDIKDKAHAFKPKSPKSSLNLVSVGRLEVVKGYHNLIAALGTLTNERHLDITLTLVGTGSQMEVLKEEASRLGVYDRVCFACNQPNPYPYVLAADAFVCSSLQEGFNITILEGMTLGKPIIAADSSGPREILDGGKYGILVENSVDGLTYAIEEIYGKPEKLSVLSALSQKRAADFYADLQIKKIEDLICE